MPRDKDEKNFSSIKEEITITNPAVVPIIFHQI